MPSRLHAVAMRLLLLALVGVVLPLCAAQPNFLIIVTDDQRSDTIGALGNPRIQTPHLDRLVKEGLVFSNAICSNPLCVPSRAEILTGCSGFRNGVLGMGREQMKPGLKFWAEAMREAGYHTWYSGKWMNDGKPKTRGYEETGGLFSSGGGNWKRGQVVRGRKGRAITGYRNWTFKADSGSVELEKGVGLTALTDKYIADGALRFLKRKTDKPFFLHVNFTGPHDPLIYPPGYAEKYTGAKMKLPATFLPHHPFAHGNFEGRDERLLPWPRTKADVLDELAVYYAVVDHIDKQVGRLLAQLRADGRLANTVVVFTSDHGLAVGSHGLMGKQNMYAHTIRVPFIIRGPGVPKGRKTDAFIYLRDMFPTTCEMAVIPIPATVQAKSFAPVIQGKVRSVYPMAFGYFRHVQRMAWEGDWKLIWYPEAGVTQLFDIRADPDELRDLSGEPEYKARVARLNQSMRDWFSARGDPVYLERKN